MKYYTATDIGKKRYENQDRVWAGTLQSGAVAVVLCDGMGGANAGSLASTMTVDFIAERLQRGFRPDISRNSLRNLLITSITAANSLVLDKARTDTAFSGMGTTCVICVVHLERAYIINVGDSRAYHIFDDNIQQITKDHTYVRKLVEDGVISEEEVDTIPERNCITRAVGGEPEITPDYFELDLGEDSILLLCTDGLHSYGKDSRIAELTAKRPVSGAPGRLIEYALKNGGRDNITVAVIA